VAVYHGWEGSDEGMPAGSLAKGGLQLRDESRGFPRLRKAVGLEGKGWGLMKGRRLIILNTFRRRPGLGGNKKALGGSLAHVILRGADGRMPPV